MPPIHQRTAAQAAGLWPRGRRGSDRPGSRARWTARIATAAAAAVAGSMLLAAAPALAATTADPPLLAFNANGTGHLYFAPSGSGGPNPVAAHDSGLAMAPGTSPAIVEQYNDDGPSAGLYVTAFQGSNNDLWINGPSGHLDTGLKMMPGTSPAVPNGQVYEYCCVIDQADYSPVAYQSNTGELMEATIDTANAAVPTVVTLSDLGVQLDPKSSPAMAPDSDSFSDGATINGEAIAYHGAGGHLGLIRPGANPIATTYGMSAGTSPAITPLNGTKGYEIAFNANSTNHLWVYGTAGTGDTGLDVAAGTSPGIAQITQDTYQVAFHANTGHLWTYGSDGLTGGDTGDLIRQGTSPAIFGTHPSNASNGYTVGYQSTSGDLAYYDEGAGTSVTTSYGMNSTSSPGIAENGGIGAYSGVFN